MTPDELLSLRDQRKQIVALLDVTDQSAACTALRPRPPNVPVPLTRTQTVFWDSGRRMQRTPIRQIASATRLCGRLHLGALRASLTEVLRRHEALRARIVEVDGVPVQDIAESSLCDLRTVDLSALPALQREQEMKTAIRSLILEPFRFDIGPLAAVQLVKLRDEEHLLIVALEHMISDAYSLNVLLRDLLAVYARSLDQRAPAPLPVAIQHADYAVWQRLTEESWVAEHQGHWQRVLDYPAVRFPGPHDAAINCLPGWEIESTLIRSDQKLALRNWCQSRGTTLAMGVLTAYSAAVLRWCGVHKGVLRCVTDGRALPEVQNTIGVFAAPMYLRAAHVEGDSFLDFLGHLTWEYCEAYRHADLYYLQSTLPRSEHMRTPIFNWIPEEPKLESPLLRGSPDVLACSSVEFDNPLYELFAMDSDPILLLYDRSDDLFMELLYPRSRFGAASMQRFVHSLLLVINSMLERPEQAVAGVGLPADHC